MNKLNNNKKIEMDSIIVKHIEVEVLPDGRMTLENAAKFLGFSRHSLYNRHLEKDMPPYIKVRKRIYYFYDDLIKWTKKFPKISPNGEKL
jgi:predicted DNA-binding transcriptional regulator AlpA